MKTKVLILTLLAICLTGCRRPNETKVLNNFVTQLLEVADVSGPHTEYTFSNPRDGWIFISSTVTTADSGQVTLTIDSKSVQDAVLVHKADKERTLEAMRFLPAGEHKVNILSEGGLLPEKLSVRAIPELIFCRYGGNPSVSEYGPYDWKFLEKNILSNVSTIVIGAGDQLPAPLIEQWKSRGKKWLGGCRIPGMVDIGVGAKVGKESQAPKAYGYWTDLLNQSPHLDGLIADEFYGYVEIQDRYVHWSQAIEKIHAQERYRDKVFYGYIGGVPFNLIHKEQQSRAFIQTLMDCGYRVSWERYPQEEPTEEAARNKIESYVTQEMVDWRKVQPDIAKHMIVCFGLFSTPPISLNVNPGANYKVWTDMQVNVVANDPAFSDIAGLKWWTAHYADEETVRWTGKLLRHYCIEGRTEMLSRDPYKLTHIQNPDFNKGTTGWTITAAEEGAIEVKNYADYGLLQNRHYTPEGNNFLCMRRSGKRPNVFSQEIKALQPGRAYSLKMITADYKDLIERKSNKQTHTVNIEIEDAEVDVDKCFQHSFTSRRPRRGLWTNYHWLIFRAKSNTAKLVISDWASDKEPGGPIGQELIYNFIEIQPYLED